MAVLGYMNETSKELIWRTPYLCPHLVEINKSPYTSCKFLFGGEVWFLTCYPNGSTEDDSIGYVSIHLFRCYSGPSLSLDFTVSLKTVHGKKEKLLHCRNIFQDTRWGFGVARWISRAELFERASEFLSSDNLLTVVFSIKFSEVENIVFPLFLFGIATAQCSYCKEIVNAEICSSHKKKCKNKPIMCPECCDVIVLQNWYDHECQAITPKGDIYLAEDYKKVLLDGENHDLILRVGNKELRAHQDILRARSHVFDSMLSHNMEENSGIIYIPDCDPQTMELFLLYVYCGKVEALDQNNVFGLYNIADRYDVKDLKCDCCNFIRKSLSPTNTCRAIQLALNHSDTDLLEAVKDYFMNNVLDIMRTVEWQMFLKENTVVGNELLMKSFAKLKTNI